MTDFVTFGETPLRFTPQGRKRFATAEETLVHADGTESNAAVAAAELGSESLWLSKLPETPPGRRVVTELEQQGIETQVTWTTDDTLRQGVVFHERGSEPRESGYWHDRQYTTAATAVPGDFPMKTVQNASVVFTGLSTPALSPETAETTKALLRASGGKNTVTAMELDYREGLAPPERYRETFENLSGEVDVLLATESTIETVLEQSGSPRELANVLCAEYDLQIVNITKADGQSIALHDTAGTSVINERESVPVEVVDPAGTRGAFAGVFLERLVAGDDTATALNYAVAARALVQTIPGPFLTTTPGELASLADVIEANA